MITRKLLAIGLIALLFLPATAMSDTAKGRIKFISNKASTIQIDVKGKEPVVVRFGADTQYEGTSGIKDLGPPDLIQVEFEKGKPASKIKKIIFGLPEGVEIGIKELLAILQGKQGKYLLGDGRPAKHFPGGHIPSAISSFPKADDFLSKLPEDKSQLVVFYCGGPTCPFTKQSVELAMANGYTNVKGFQKGLPGWKKSKLPVHTSRPWLSKNLDEHHIVIDVRSSTAAKQSHIKGAVGMSATRFVAMTKGFIKDQKVAQLPAVTDKGAPIILYSDSHTSRDVLTAFKELRSWGYKNTSILEGGFKTWSADGLPTEAGKLAGEIKYSKKLAKGAIAPSEFAALEKTRAGVVIVDVRRADEVEKEGMLKGAMHIPLDTLSDSLAKLPKDKEAITYCENGIRAEMAAQTLKDNGYKARFLNETIKFDAEGNYSL